MARPETSEGAGGPVALVIQRAIREDGYARYTRWLGAVASELAAWPGFTGQEVIPPVPPFQDDWVVVLRFAEAASAQTWLTSTRRQARLAEVADLVVGGEDVHLLPDASPTGSALASAVITFAISEADEPAFLDWQRQMQTLEEKAKGFLHHKVERPRDGFHSQWIIILSFDNAANLTAWLDSPERKAQLEKGARFNAELKLRQSNYGFDFWFRSPETQASPPLTTFKNNLIVLLVLYPVVYLWGFFIDRPFLSGQGLPFWLSLFIGNVASTQLLGWWVAPAAFRRLSWWLAPRPGLRRDLMGYGLLAVLYGLSMAVFAALLHWNWGH